MAVRSLDARRRVGSTILRGPTDSRSEKGKKGEISIPKTEGHIAYQLQGPEDVDHGSSRKKRSLMLLYNVGLGIFTSPNTFSECACYGGRSPSRDSYASGLYSRSIRRKYWPIRVTVWWLRSPDSAGLRISSSCRDSSKVRKASNPSLRKARCCENAIKQQRWREALALRMIRSLLQAPLDRDSGGDTMAQVPGGRG
jgi:hypothetical protein